MKKNYVPGKRGIFIGDVAQFGYQREMHHPEVEWAAEGEDLTQVMARDPENFGRILPVYPLTEGVSQKVMRRIMRETGAMLIGFGIATVGVVLGTWVGLRIVPLGPEGPALAGMFAATYIGGSLNFVAVAQATQFASSARMAASIAADALVGALYLLVLMLLPSIAWLRRRMTQACPLR